MKITDVKTFVVDRGSTNYVFVKLYTDVGIDGVGEATLEGKELSVVAAIQEVARGIVDKNPLDIEAHWRRWHMTSCWKGVTDFTAISGLEQAMWDIAGKAYDTPVYRLLGGPVRDSVRAYTWPGPYESPEECGQAAAHAVDPYVSVELDEDVVRAATVHHEGLDVGDFHEIPPHGCRAGSPIIA